MHRVIIMFTNTLNQIIKLGIKILLHFIYRFSLLFYTQFRELFSQVDVNP